MKTICVLNLKGGVGRSTVATNLAGTLGKGAKSVLIDADQPQGTAISWWALGGLDNDLSGLHNREVDAVKAHTAEDMIEEVRRREDRRYSWCVIDTPPRLASLTRAALLLSDLVLIPVAASAGEIWACSDVVDLIKEADQVRKIDARLMWNRHRKNTKIAQEISEEAEKILGLPVMRSSLGLRVAYVEAMGMGVTAVEMLDPVARNEILSLVDEVKTILEDK
jgi:chromosome partitioning protein